MRIEEFEYIFAPEQARELLPIWDELGHLTLIGHSHLCKVFALTPYSVEELPVADFTLEPEDALDYEIGQSGVAVTAKKSQPAPRFRVIPRQRVYTTDGHRRSCAAS